MKIHASNLRVYLKTFDLVEADRLAENANDYDIAYNIARIGDFPYPYQKSDALYFVEAAIQKFYAKSEFHFGIHTQETGLMGACVIKNIDFDNKKAEIGYWIGKKYWGRGYAKEALRLLISFGFNFIDLNKIYALTFAFNERSINLLNSLNFSKDGTLRQNVLQADKFIDESLFSLLKNDCKDDIKLEISDVQKR